MEERGKYVNLKLDIFREKSSYRLYEATALLAFTLEKVVSRSTVERTLQREGWTYKKTEKRCVFVNEEERIAYMETISSIPPHHLIDIDESSCSPDQFYDNFGWAPKGKPAIRYQYVISGRSFTTIAAYSIFGFLQWEIYEGPVTGDQVIDFMDRFMRPTVTPDSILLFDNAKIHTRYDVELTLAEVFIGGFCHILVI